MKMQELNTLAGDGDYAAQRLLCAQGVISILSDYLLAFLPITAL